MSADFSKSSCKRLRVFILLLVVAGVVLEEEAGGLCLCVNEEGFLPRHCIV